MQNLRMLHRLVTIAVCAFCLALVTNMAIAATYYVSNSGSDSNSGASDTPWRTIKKAVGAAQAGDSVIVRSGVYDDEGQVSTVRDGTSAAYITIKGEKSPVAAGFLFSHSYVRVEGFALNGKNVKGYSAAIIFAEGNNGHFIGNAIKDTPRLVSGISMGTKVQNARIENNQIVNTGFHMMNLAGSGHVISGNYFENINGWDAIRMMASNTMITGNNFTNVSNIVGNSNHPDIIQTFSSNGEISVNVIFERNLIKNCVGTQIGMMEDQALKGMIGNWTFRNNVYANVEAAIHIYGHDVYWYNNVFYKSGVNTGGPILFRYSTNKGAGHNGKVFNNIFVECGKYGSGSYGIESGAMNVKADYNMVIGPKGASATVFKEPHGITGGNPGFVNAAAYDFSLSDGSPAIDAGIVLSGFADDFNGMARPFGSGWDIGAFEFGNAVKPPAGIRVLPPQNN